MEAIIDLTKQIEDLESNIDALYDERKELIDAICKWMARVHKQHITIGNVLCCLEVYPEGTFKWYGIVSRTTLDVIEKLFLNYLREEHIALKERLI